MSLKIQQLTLKIGDTLVCKDLNIEFMPGKLWAILGVNGVGKSTLLHHMLNIPETKTNEIFIDDKPLDSFRNQRKQLAKKIGILLQEYEYSFPCTVLEATLIGRHPYLSEWQWESEEDLKLAENTLKQTEIVDLKDRLINTLSGGEKRRLNIATLLTQNPEYLLLDEPTNHLDLRGQITILNLLKQHIINNQKSGVMVIHDANLANRYCENVLMLYGNGKWEAGTTSELINKNNLQQLYGCPIQVLSNDTQTAFLPC